MSGRAVITSRFVEISARCRQHLAQHWYKESVLMAQKGNKSSTSAEDYGDPKGIRTPVTAVKGQCPRPLDDGVVEGGIYLAGGP